MLPSRIITVKTVTIAMWQRDECDTSNLLIGKRLCEINLLASFRGQSFGTSGALVASGSSRSVVISTPGGSCIILTGMMTVLTKKLAGE